MSTVAGSDISISLEGDRAIGSCAVDGATYGRPTPKEWGWMGGIADAHTIDLVAQDAYGIYLLVMVEDRPWGSDTRQAAQLREKINTYARYVLDGSLVKDYPETSGGQVRIRLDCCTAPIGHFEHIVAHATRTLLVHNIEFQINPRT